MNEQHKLMERAIKVRDPIHQKNNGAKFYIWLEETFGIEHYEKEFRQDHHIARVDNVDFVWADSRVMSAALFANCLLCGEENLPQKIGIIKTLEELSNFIERDADENLYFVCGNHSSGISEQKPN